MRIDMFLSGLNIVMAFLLLEECLRGMRKKSLSLLVVFPCALAYVILEAEWLLTDQTGQIGDLRSILWLFIEFGLMFGCYLSFRRERLRSK